MKIVASTPSNTMSLQNAAKADKGLIVQVYDNYVSFLTPYNHPNDSSINRPDFAFWEVGKGGSYSYNTATNGRNKAIERAAEDNEAGLFYFATLEDFCKTALEKGWKFYP
jgi:hypothetical protein